MYIAIHALFLCLAVPPAFLVFYRKKGDTTHKRWGWLFVIGMSASSIASFGIKVYKHGYSPIHLLSAITLLLLGGAIAATRMRFSNWRYVHALCMTAAFVGVFIAGVGVVVRHSYQPMNIDAGLVASAIAAIAGVWITLSVTRRYRARRPRRPSPTDATAAPRGMPGMGAMFGFLFGALREARAFLRRTRAHS